MTVSSRFASPLVLGLALWLAGCGHWKKPIEPNAFQVPESCPDFSGVYWYAGAEEAAVCGMETSAEATPISGVMLPAFDASDLRGGYVKIVAQSTVELHQRGCREIVFTADESRLKPVSQWPEGAGLLDPRVYESRRQSWSLSLVPEIQGTTVEWAEGSLEFSTRFLAGGFGAGWGIERMRFWLENTEDGSLKVEFRHEQGASGNTFLGSRCRLPPAE